jgi:hypothetical protein
MEELVKTGDLLLKAGDEKRKFILEVDPIRPTYRLMYFSMLLRENFISEIELKALIRRTYEYAIIQIVLKFHFEASNGTLDKSDFARCMQ